MGRAGLEEPALGGVPSSIHSIVGGRIVAQSCVISNYIGGIGLA